LLLLQALPVGRLHCSGRPLPAGQQKLVCPAHTFPQAPQLLVVFSGLQTPLQQPSPAAQAFPQAPQLLVVFSGLQTPLQQPWPAAQAVPQAPQLLVVFSGVQWPLQQP
jgi:hypothetical protein